MIFVSKFKNLFSKKHGDDASKSSPKPKTHYAHGIDFSINLKAINHNVIKITRRLTDAGYQAYLVGGGVRDLLLSRTPKDFDIATNATPEQIRKLFRNCRLIGRRFRLAHIYFRSETIEVATFRAHHTQAKHSHQYTDEGMIVHDNIYGDLEEDAERRDFTVNALYYDVQK